MAHQLSEGKAPDGSDESQLSHERLSAAVRSFEADPNLRWFLREWLGFCGLLPQASIFSPDATMHAYNAGVQAAGLRLLETLAQVEPNLWPMLQMEHNDAS